MVRLVNEVTESSLYPTALAGPERSKRMLETVTFHHAQALAHRPANGPHHAAPRRKPSALRAFRAQWRRLRRLVVKPGRELAIPRVS